MSDEIETYFKRAVQMQAFIHAGIAPKPSECTHCEYDRRFPDFEGGGWMQQDNNGPIVSCPMCNDDGSHPRCPQESTSD